MTSWFEDWSSALSHSTNGYEADKQAVGGIAATYIPHPALASSREASEWERVLSAAKASTASAAAAAAAGAAVPTAGAVQGVARISGCNGVYAVIELGSHSTRLLISNAAGSADVVSIFCGTQDVVTAATACCYAVMAQQTVISNQLF
jgi:hypothetical protein